MAVLVSLSLAATAIACGLEIIKNWYRIKALLSKPEKSVSLVVGLINTREAWDTIEWKARLRHRQSGIEVHSRYRSQVYLPNGARMQISDLDAYRIDRAWQHRDANAREERENAGLRELAERVLATYAR